MSFKQIVYLAAIPLLIIAMLVTLYAPPSVFAFVVLWFAFELMIAAADWGWRMVGTWVHGPYWWEW